MRHTKYLSLALFSLCAALLVGLQSVSANESYEMKTPAVVFDANIRFSATLDGNTVVTKWSGYTHNEDFSYTKVVRSQKNGNPVYPDDGYIFYTGDTSVLSYTDTDVPDGQNYYRVCHITAKNRYCSKTVVAIAYTTPKCRDREWLPKRLTAYKNEKIKQTSNCGNTRKRMGTKRLPRAVKPPVTNTAPVVQPTPVVTPVTPTSTAAPKIGMCSIFPADNAWNTDISRAAVHPNSANYINSIGLSGHLHADFGGGGEYGIPWITVDGSQMSPINFTAYGDESDAGPYPIPVTAPIEWGVNSNGDRHVLAVDTKACMLYELYRAVPNYGSWNADSAAKYDLSSNAVRPAGWTSADAAGLPIFPGLARYDEVKAGAMNHALRFTVSKTQKAYVYPARHYASSSTDTNLPPMGLRLRLKADYDISKFTGQSRVVLETLKKYGMIVADNGSNWYITGDANPGWSDDDLNQLKTVPGSAFEAIESPAAK